MERDTIYSGVLLVLLVGLIVVFVGDIYGRVRRGCREVSRGNVAVRRDLLVTLGKFLFLGSLYLGITISLIYVNAWILDEIFPYAATLTLIQQLICAVLSAGILLGLKTPLEDITVRIWMEKFLVLGLLFAIYLWGSNLAYVYLEVGYIQMIKPVGGFLIYATLLASGYETIDVWKFITLIAIFGAVSIASCGQEELGAFNVVGLGILIASLCGNAFYYTMLQYLLQPPPSSTKQRIKLNPIMTMALVGPAAALWLALVAALTEWNQSSFSWSIPTWLLLLDSVLAFALNITIMYMLQAFSALTYALCGYSKDVIVVGLSTILVNEQVSNLEWHAYAVMLVGQALWIVRKIDNQIDDIRSGDDLLKDDDDFATMVLLESGLDKDHGTTDEATGLLTPKSDTLQ